MKQENEPWIDRLKRQVDHYEKPLPEDDWNDFEKQLFTPFLRRKRRVKWMRIAALIFLLAVPSSLLIWLSEKEEMQTITYMATSYPIVKEDNPPSPLPESIICMSHPVVKIKPAERLTTEDNEREDSTLLPETPPQDTVKATPSQPQAVKRRPTHREVYQVPAPKRHSVSTLALAVSTGNGSTGSGILNKSFSRGDAATDANDKLYWTDFKAQLQESAKDYPDKQMYAALLQIADDNIGHPMMEHSRYSLPVSVALSFRKQLGLYWGVAAGLQYTYLSSESSLGEQSEWISRQKLHYVGLSLKLDRTLYSTRTFAFYAAAGGTIEKSVSGKLEQDFIIKGEKVYSCDENRNMKPMQFSLNGTLGAQYNATSTFGIFAEPGVAFYFENDSDIRTIRNEHPLNFNLQVGVRWNY